MARPEGATLVSGPPLGATLSSGPPVGAIPVGSPVTAVPTDVPLSGTNLWQGRGMGRTDPEGPTDAGIDKNPQGTLREVAHGSSFGMSDEIEAMVRSAADPGGWSSEQYFADIQKERQKYRSDNPYISVGLEVMGGLMVGAPVAKALGVGSGLASAGLRQGTAGAIEAGTYGFFSGDEFFTPEDLGSRLKMAGYASLLGGITGGTVGIIGQKFNPTYKEAQSKILGRKLRDALKDETPAEQLSVLEQAMYQEAIIRKMKGSVDDIVDIPSPLKFAQEMSEELDLPFGKMLEQARKKGGFLDFQNMSTQELAEGAVGIAKQPQALRAAAILRPGGTGVKATFDNSFAPIKRVMTNQVSEEFGNLHNRAQNRSLLQQAKWHDETAAPVRDIKLWLDQPTAEALNAKEKLLNAALEDDTAISEFRTIIREKFGQEMLDNWDKYQAGVYKWASRYHNSVNSEAPVTRGWLHTQMMKQKDPGLIKSDKVPNTYADVSARMRTRKILDDEWDVVQQYENPLRSMDNWIDEQAGTINTAELFVLRPAGRGDLVDSGGKTGKKLLDFQKKVADNDKKALVGGADAGYIGRAMREKMAQQGFGQQQIENAVRLTHNVLYDAQRSPLAVVRAIRDMGYMGTIFNPYGAVLNLHDIPNAAASMGWGTAMKSLLQNSELSVKDVGLFRQYMGEYTKKISGLTPTKLEKFFGMTEKAGEKSAQWGGFRKLDAYGKEKIMQMSLNEARKAVRKGNFDDQWKHTFSPNERRQIKIDLSNGETSDLVKELAMFRLSGIQPINAAQSTRYSLRHPNARIFYMLKNYAIRQLDYFRENSIVQWKKGNKAKAAEFALKYAVYSGGGFALINEARQPLKWREPNLDPDHLAKVTGRQLASVGLLGVPGVSDYAWDKTTGNLPGEMASAIVPPLNLLEASYKDIYKLLAEGEPPKEVLKNFPVLGKVFFEPILTADEDQ